MKLKNKRTGEIGELQITEKHCAVSVGNGTASCGIEIYSSLNGLNEEWEDYEEPKTHWMIDTSILEPVREIVGNPYEIDREIGNWFNTKEEAELAIRKLKAWKRLKDKGFRFDGYELVEGNIHFIIDLRPLTPDDLYPDLDICFGGEE